MSQHRILITDDDPQIVRLVKSYLEQAGFAVLKSPDIPSILVETAFISNPEEEKKLNYTNIEINFASLKQGSISCNNLILKNSDAEWKGSD